MGLNKTKGNMYEWCDYTWNPIKGKCSHDCKYCYMKRFPQGKVHLDEKELKTDLGSGNLIFVGSSCDLWAVDIPAEWIIKVVAHCKRYPKNTYLFQTKNPMRYVDFLYGQTFPNKVILGTTIETNRAYEEMGVTPHPSRRAKAMETLKARGYNTMVTLEPLMDFDIESLSSLIRQAYPNWVNIGADSKNHGLPEPSKEKIEELIILLNEFTEVRHKHNLGRLMK